MDLSSHIGSITLRNPLILASGVLGTSYSTLMRSYKAGLGAVTTKSIGPRPRIGNPNPSIFALQEIRSVINSVGLANPGYQHLKEDLKLLTNEQIPVIASVFGASSDEIIEVVKGLNNIEILGFELNLSCPNTDKEGLIQGIDPDFVKNIVRLVKKETKLPVWIKLTPNISDIITVASAAIESGCNALVAINTLKAMVIDIQTKKPILGYKRGGLSGAAIKPIGIRYIYDLYEEFGDKVPLIGVGGIFRAEDVIEYLLAGASAVQIGTAIGVAYPENMIRFILTKLQKYMKEHGYNSINEITGGAHK
jgi:dihydroorotate dehydrogenase (NAD+) catalytic subunit